MAKKKDHTGFRNEALFCFNCGSSYKMAMPAPVTIASAIMKQFVKDHKNCLPTWKEPEAPENKSVEERAAWWIKNGETGSSSKTIWQQMTAGVHRPHNVNYPSDPDDFKRCHKLLKVIPEWRARMQEMAPLHPVWAKLAENWDKLTDMYEENERTKWKEFKRIGMYDFMKSLGC